MSILKSAAAAFALSIFFGLALAGLAVAQQADMGISAQPPGVTTPAVTPVAPDEILAGEASADIEPETGAPAGAEPWIEHLAGKLGLTPDQQMQAQVVFDHVRTDIKALHDQAHEQIRALLTDQQKATFDSLSKPPFAAHRGDMRGFQGGGMAGGGGAGFVNRLTEKLGLTPDQVASVTTIHDNLRSAVDQRRDAAKTQFDALLTPDQITTLNALRAERPMGAGPVRGGEMRHPLGQKLGLTEEQRTQARTIFQQTHAGVKALRDQAREQVSALLTDDQKAKLDSVWPQGGPGQSWMGWARPSAGGSHRGLQGAQPGKMRDGLSPVERQQAFLDRLQKGLGLTADQLTSVRAVLDTLHSSTSALRDAARQQFRALLTPEQTTILDQMKAEHTAAPRGTAG
jgi:Spy/CpxP family protein refolding chaperone